MKSFLIKDILKPPSSGGSYLNGTRRCPNRKQSSFPAGPSSRLSPLLIAGSRKRKSTSDIPSNEAPSQSIRLAEKASLSATTFDVSDAEEIDVDNDDGTVGNGLTQSEWLKSSVLSNGDDPLKALCAMTEKSFVGDKVASSRHELALEKVAQKSGPVKKRRKSRTAFSNQQIYELERRFLYQKYLTPADRDELSSKLHLSNAQVITWFQNRRAKLKRDIEELKADVTATKCLDKVNAATASVTAAGVAASINLQFNLGSVIAAANLNV